MRTGVNDSPASLLEEVNSERSSQKTRDRYIGQALRREVSSMSSGFDKWRGVELSLHGQKARGGGGPSRLGRSKMSLGKTSTFLWQSSGCGFDSWLEGGPCATLRQSLPIALKAAGVFSDGATQA